MIENKDDINKLNDSGDHLILVVDDMRDNVLILETFLKKRGYRTMGAYSGVEAMKKVTEHNPDLLMMDLNMPGMSGLEVCREIRKEVKYETIGIILVTASSDVNDILEGFATGSDDYLNKPYQHMEMLARVRSVLKMRDAQHNLIKANNQLDNINKNLETIVKEQVGELSKVNRLRRYFSPQLVDTFLAEDSAPFLAGNKKEITVTFLDLRNFTTFAEKNNSEDVMNTLSEFHKTVGPVIFSYNATLERFTGDGLMAFIGAPHTVKDHAQLSVDMAMALQDSVAPLADQWRKKGYDLELGIGISTGIASTGTIGFEGRMDYAAIGSVTNLSARLCSIADGGEILISGSTVSKLSEKMVLISKGEINLKGFSKATEVYAVQKNMN